jgi:hypothetical protein
MWSGRCLSALLLIAPVLSAQSQRTVMLPLKQPDCPAIMVRMVHAKDFLQAATLKNVGTAPITGYRIGWVEVYREGRDKVGLGYRVDVPEGIDPTKTTEVPAQGVSDRSYWDGAIAVVFFVAEVRTATGTAWKAELDSVEDDARKMAETTVK